MHYLKLKFDEKIFAVLIELISTSNSLGGIAIEFAINQFGVNILDGGYSQKHRLEFSNRDKQISLVKKFYGLAVVNKL